MKKDDEKDQNDKDQNDNNEPEEEQVEKKSPSLSDLKKELSVLKNKMKKSYNSADVDRKAELEKLISEMEKKKKK